MAKNKSIKGMLYALFTATLVGLPIYLQAATYEVDIAACNYMYDTYPFSGTADGSYATNTPLYVGDQYYSSVHRLDRGRVVFELPEISSDEVITSITLVLTISGVSANSDGLMENLVLYHSQTDNGTTATPFGPYSDTSYTDTGIVLATPETRDDAPVTLEYDVMSIVMSDYDLDPTSDQVAAFRLQVDGLDIDAILDTTTNHLYVVGGTNNPDVSPKLIIETAPVPEPATVGILLGLCALGRVLIHRRSRG